MIHTRSHLKKSFLIALLPLCASLGSNTLASPGALASQGALANPADDPYDVQEGPSPEQIAALVAPIALYPDDLIAIILPASTEALDIVLAARYLQTSETSQFSPPEGLHPSVLALMHYPEVLENLNNDLAGTRQLGFAVNEDEALVLTQIQRLRREAESDGRLRSDDYQVVETVSGAIMIRSRDPQVVHIPQPTPSKIIRTQPLAASHYPVRVIRYRAAPVYYYPYRTGHRHYRGWYPREAPTFSLSWRHARIHRHPRHGLHGPKGRMIYLAPGYGSTFRGYGHGRHWRSHDHFGNRHHFRDRAHPRRDRIHRHPERDRRNNERHRPPQIEREAPRNGDRDRQRPEVGLIDRDHIRHPGRINNQLHGRLRGEDAFRPETGRVQDRSPDKTAQAKQARNAKPVLERGTVPPVRDHRATKPIKERKTARPVKELRKVKLVRERRTVPPARDHRATKPIKERRTAKFVKERRAAKPTQASRITRPPKPRKADARLN